MKFVSSSFVVLAFFASALLAFAESDINNFPGVQKAMSPQAFEQAGLHKLTPEERARLDEFIRGYAASHSQEAAAAAVDQAVKENKVASQPQVIESRIVGRYTGYNGRSRFTLENGQVWAQSQQESRAYPPTDSPPVIIVKGTFGHRMYVVGGGNFRVIKIH
ncbi:MAG: hypothetical protein M3Z22_02015 [Verrucomicrobiota bacterium]|nr:hypothetical protein [Verrucomicrobiota bacterium]